MKTSSLFFVALLAPLFLSGCAVLNGGPNNRSNHTVVHSRGTERDQSASCSQAKEGEKPFDSIGVKPESLPEPVWEITPEVRREVSLFLGRERVFFERAIERRARYEPMLQQVFEDEGVPVDLVSLALVESGYNADARSPVGALGMWQFMKSTASIYGLKVHKGEDQRRDPILSSIAAARHLRDLYETHGDWYLALAAYNAGSGGVMRALERGKCSDYWSLVRGKLLTEQTRRFVPRIIAAALITKNLERYDMNRLAKKLDWLKDGENVRFARWSGARYSPLG